MHYPYLLCMLFTYVCPAHLILLHLVTPATCSEQHKSRSSSLRHCAAFLSLSPTYAQISSSAPSLWCLAQCERPSFALIPTDIMLQTEQRTSGFHNIHNLLCSLCNYQLSTDCITEFLTWLHIWRRQQEAPWVRPHNTPLFTPSPLPYCSCRHPARMLV